LSLRQAKKEKTAKAILDAASARFVADGIDAAPMETIAADAEVSVGTLYNYFGSKQSLLMALFAAEVGEMLEAGGVAVSDDVDPFEAVHHLFDVYLEGMLAINRDLLREVLRFSLGGGDAVHELARLDLELMTQLAGVLAYHQESGRISASIVIDDAVFILYSVLITELLMYLSLDDVDPSALRTNVTRRVELVFRGINN
jgi:AcrR family transcriptional regulator